MSAGGRYDRILRAPDVMPLIDAALAARLPIGIDSIAIVLFLRERTGSYAAAGIVSAAFALGGGAGAPLSGRLIDRFGHRRVLVPLALVHGGGSRCSWGSRCSTRPWRCSCPWRSSAAP